MANAAPAILHPILADVFIFLPEWVRMLIERRLLKINIQRQSRLRKDHPNWPDSPYTISDNSSPGQCRSHERPKSEFK